MKTDRMKTVLSHTPSSVPHRATPRRRAVLGILFALGMVVGCEESTVTYTVTFNTNGGTAVTTAKVQSGKQVQRPTPDPTKKDNAFLDWYADKGFSQPYDFATPVTKNITLYARWSPQNIPDANFRAALKTIIPNAFIGDWLDTTHADVKEHEELDVSDKTISNLRGIEYFTSLTKLECNKNQLTGLDVSHNAALTELYCHDNQLDTLDVSHNMALTKLICDKNQLTQLDVSTNTSLTSLSCNNNQLTQLDVSTNTILERFLCGYNQLDTLDVSANTILTILSCNNNQLDTLDVSANTILTILTCNNNQLTALNISANTVLTVLYCNNNQLTDLDVSTNTILTRLICNKNQLTQLDMTGIRNILLNDLVIDAGVEGKNLITTLKVHDNLKNHDELKEAKTSRGDTLKIMTYTTPYARSTDYTLSCANYDPNVGDDGKCIIEPTSFTVASAGGVDSVRTSTTLQFSITDVDPTDADGRVTWTITDNDASNSKGTIDADGGLYTAPATVPSPATVTITATSTVAPAISNTFEITVVQ